MSEETANLSLRRYWHLLVDYLRPQRGAVILLAALLLGNISLQLVNPQIVRYFLDAAETGSGLTRMFDIRQARQAELRQHVGMVTQEVQLFQATVRQNLTLFDETVGDARILEVVEDIGLDDWLSGLPDGLDTALEAGGSGLSAGEAQLLAFARVFLTDPGLVILDEASSRLDPATEQRIEKAVDKLLADRTGIIIAHRLGTVERADEIMILADGRITEHGRRAELAGDPDSRFYGLLRTGLEEALA
jgi:ATP-binding cassette subfamily B protein